MTAAVALVAKDKGGPEFKCQVMLWPVTDANFDPSLIANTPKATFSRAMMQWFWDAYAPDRERRREIHASRSRRRWTNSRTASSIDSSGRKRCPPRRRPRYGHKLDSAGVDVTIVRYENLIHDYGLLNAISQVPAVRDALHQTAEM